MFKGSGVALVTPFDKNNKVNFDTLEKLLEFHLLNSTDAIIVCGTTGEAATMSIKEKKEVIKFCVEYVNKKIPVIAGTGSNSTSDAIKNTKIAENLGADGTLVVTPYYNKCNQEGLYKHFKAIAKSTSLPIILYNVPSRTGVNIEVNTVKKLSYIENIVGIKEASSNISQIADIINNTNLDFNVYSGNDDQILPILALGGSGVISVFANIYPKETHDICYEFFNENISTARDLQLKYLKLIHYLFSDVNPIPVKEALNYLGFKVGKCRLPLSKLSLSKHKKLIKEIDKINNN